MRQLALVLVGFAFVAALAAGMVSARQQNLAAIGTQSTTLSADDFYADARKAIFNELAAYVQANPTRAVSTLAAYTENGATATVTVQGDTLSNTNSNETAVNLNTAIKERRVAFNIFVTPGTHEAAITHHVIVSAFGYSPYIHLVSDNVTASTIGSTLHTAVDTSGCAGTGLGCDPSGVQTADPSTLSSALACVQGVGSGTCPASNQFPDPTYTTQPWTDNQ